jgi:hypothetical protein
MTYCKKLMFCGVPMALLVEAPPPAAPAAAARVSMLFISSQLQVHVQEQVHLSLARMTDVVLAMSHTKL